MSLAITFPCPASICLTLYSRGPSLQRQADKREDKNHYWYPFFEKKIYFNFNHKFVQRLILHFYSQELNLVTYREWRPGNTAPAERLRQLSCCLCACGSVVSGESLDYFILCIQEVCDLSSKAGPAGFTRKEEIFFRDGMERRDEREVHWCAGEKIYSHTWKLVRLSTPSPDTIAMFRFSHKQ